jgi:hypothetical protein
MIWNNIITKHITLIILRNGILFIIVIDFQKFLITKTILISKKKKFYGIILSRQKLLTVRTYLMKCLDPLKYIDKLCFLHIIKYTNELVIHC